MKGNGVAALRVWPVMVELAGTTYRIPALPAIRWIVPIVDDDWIGIVPGLVDSEDPGIDDALDDGVISHEECVLAAHDAVAAAAGMSWWAAVRLVSSAVAQPDITGELVMSGVDVQVVSLGAYVQAVYRILTRDTDKKQRAKIDRQIESPPEGMTVSERARAAGAGSGFEAMMRQRGGRV